MPSSLDRVQHVFVADKRFFSCLDVFFSAVPVYTVNAASTKLVPVMSCFVATVRWHWLVSAGYFTTVFFFFLLTPFIDIKTFCQLSTGVWSFSSTHEKNVYFQRDFHGSRGTVTDNIAIFSSFFILVSYGVVLCTHVRCTARKGCFICAMAHRAT